MKKYMNMPDVKVVRFDNKDVIVTSNEPSMVSNVPTVDNVGNNFVQERHSIWD